MEKETLIKIINTLVSVKVEVNEAPKIIGVINILQNELEKKSADGKEGK